jgi:RecA-family ATPase
MVNDTMTATVATNDEQFEAVAKWADENQINAGQTVTPAVVEAGPVEARPLWELVRSAQGDPNELLKYRYLCRGGGLLLVGPTGIGKSSLSMQLMLSWALGREVFGIYPSRPLIGRVCVSRPVV